MRSARGLVVGLVAIALSVGACGNDDPTTADAVAAASTCAELVDAYEVDSVNDEEAELIAARLVALAEADFAEDGILDDKATCNRVIFDLDPNHASAFEGIDLEEMGD